MLHLGAATHDADSDRISGGMTAGDDFARALAEVPVTSKVLWALGFLSFWASTHHDFDMANVWLLLSSVLMTWGFLWRAGSNWRGQTEHLAFFRQLLSTHVLAMLFWLVLFAGSCLLFVLSVLR
jgi:hypothetical protein